MPVLLVGHSYSGPVIAHAGTKANNVVGLVFVASFGLDEGQSIPDSIAAFPEPAVSSALRPQTNPIGSGEAPELSIEASKFSSVFAADLDAPPPGDPGRVAAPGLGPRLRRALSVAPAWKALPSWFLVATEDNAINFDSQRAAAKRLGSTTREVAASHAVAVSQPDAVAGLILDAVKTLSG